MISKVYNLKILLLLFFVIQVFQLSADSQMKFNSKNIKEVFGMLPEVVRDEIVAKSISGNGTYYLDCKQVSKKNSLIFRINQFQELDHLGFYLIDDNKLPGSIREVLDYLENVFLVSTLLNEKSFLDREITQNRIEVFFNGSSINPKNKITVLPQFQIERNTPLKIKYDSNFFQITWLIDHSNVVEIKIPNDYFLITQKTKDELEREMFRKMNTIKFEKIFMDRPSQNQLIRFDQNVYQLPGEIYSKAPELSSSKYFILADSIKPVFTGKYYKESIRNLFLGIVPTSLILRITQKLYGGNEETLQINVNRFFNVFQPGNKIYFGWQNDDENNLKASIFISNEIYNYTHLLVVTTDKKTAFRKNGMIDGLFFAYVPKEIQK